MNLRCHCICGGVSIECIPLQVDSAANFEKDLGLDSLDVVELVMAFEEEFGIEIPDNDADRIFTVEDAVNYISQHPQAK